MATPSRPDRSHPVHHDMIRRPALPRRTLATSVLLAALFAAGCSKSDSGTAPVKPANLQQVQASTLTATVGTALATAPTFTVTDASGNALGNVAVTVAVTSGGGTLTGAPTKSSAGPTSVGTWTLGTTAGTNTLTITVSGLTPLSISATGTPGSAAKLVATAGNTQTVLAGAQATTPLAVAVQDQYNNGIAGQQVTFAVTAGGGSVTPASLTTDASGVASGALWRLGNKGGAQAVTATTVTGGFATTFTATVQTSYPLVLHTFGPAMSTAAQTAFSNAANRIMAAIILPTTTLNLTGASVAACDTLDKTLPATAQESTAGVIIYASVGTIDGVGKTLGYSFPCYTRLSNDLPVVSIMKFDEADIQNYITQGLFESVVLHEMNHAIGFGTIWPDKGLLQSPAYTGYGASATLTGSTNPRYTGTNAITACMTSGGTANHCAIGVGVAVEACGLDGTADGHWREMFTTNCTGTDRRPIGGTAAFDQELMTGYAESTPNMPWSALSIASLQDLGYTVNPLAADAFTVPSLLSMARLSLQAESGDQPREVMRRPLFRISDDGRIEVIVRGKP